MTAGVGAAVVCGRDVEWFEAEEFLRLVELAESRNVIMTLANRPLQLRVVRGWVWITRDGCPKDSVLGAGSCVFGAMKPTGSRVKNDKARKRSRHHDVMNRAKPMPRRAGERPSVLVFIRATDPRPFFRWRFTATDNLFIGQAVAPRKPNADPKSSRKTPPDARFRPQFHE